MTSSNRFVTHLVENQPTISAPYNLWRDDALLRVFVNQHLPPSHQHDEGLLDNYGQLAGDALMNHGELANKNKPILHTFDRYGRRTDNVEFHPSYHALMESAMQHNVHNYSWKHEGIGGAHTIRAALMYMHYQAESGTSCPLTMTHAAIPAMRYGKNLPTYYLEKTINGEYDPRALPACQKHGLTIGMGMTEKQGGSDVRRNTTSAYKQSDGSYNIVGHKFFFSAPMCDAHLILAQAEGGLSCFLLPRVLENGELNNVRIQRLKDKLGDWSNASSEVEFQDATAYLIGDEGRGVPVIIDMVSLTRLDCMIGSSALMRQSLVHALHHVSHRDAFGKTLIKQPLMQNVLADLTIECAAATALTMRVAKAVDSTLNNSHEAALARLATAIGKYWICKRTPMFVNEAQECLGGIGYVEENPMPRYYRQAPLNSIWEGSGNVQCLDVLRALAKEPNVKEALFNELKIQAGKNKHYDIYLSKLFDELSNTQNMETRSRYLTEQMALALQACSLLATALDNNDALIDIAHTFCESRLGNASGFAFGTLPDTTPFEKIIAFGQVSYA
ncbi:acyl-CoA dehydrogenase family protein [Alteromonas sp. PRIM-21]|uniref:acyl-CoA dehydrogenase family protein n=1 Tax=Alteromonas sp. PRIM-21 TaxID=1454978 RepID=UPI0022B990E1|nr:acyl-CoA dehydrogenase family protein [Alteromonas sp. PRIM-21]MCZ8529118.1 acyl-CoA dehydrogenase family protein [Alteromonas sp. PRIM-21]